MERNALYTVSERRSDGAPSKLRIISYSDNLVAICVPLIILVISKTARKSYTISKTIIWTQSWICVEIHNLDLHIFEILSKIMHLDLLIFENISKIIDLDIQILDLELQIDKLNDQIYDF